MRVFRPIGWRTVVLLAAIFDILMGVSILVLSVVHWDDLSRPQRLCIPVVFILTAFVALVYPPTLRRAQREWLERGRR